MSYDEAATVGTMLVGRRHDLQSLVGQVRTVLRDADGGIVTITGLPGVGRSSLAAAALEELAADGTASVVVPVTVAGDPLGVADAVLARLPGHRLNTSLPEALWEVYDGIPVVLVLEEVDRVQGLDSVVADLVAGYPAAAVLCTALRPTHVPGERVVRLPPLALPADDAPADDPTILLFARRARAHGAALDLDDPRVRADVARICRLTGGLPGVIELAAARVGVIPPAVMARTLAGPQGLGMLRPVGGDPHRDIEAALTWSFELLSKAAQRTLAQVSVFEGPFLLDAASAVVDLGSIAQEPVDSVLELLETHLLDVDPDRVGEPRFVVPALVRGFARRLLAADESADAVRDRHAAFFRSRSLAGPDVVRREWADITAALDHETRRGDFDDALSAAVTLAPVVQEIPGLAAHLQDRLTELLEHGDSAPFKLRAQALVWSATAYPGGIAQDLYRLGVWTGQRLAEATALARESGDGPALLEALELTVRSLRITLDLPAAVAAAHEGLQLAQRLDDQRALARFEAWVSMASRLGGDTEESARLAASAVVRGREHHDSVAVIYGSQLLLDAPAELRPSVDPPPPDLETLLTECERLGQPFAAMTVLGSLARAASVSGDLPAAARWLRRLLMLAANRHRTEPMATLGGTASLVSVAVGLGRLDDAVRLRESVRPLESFVQYCLAPVATKAYFEDVATFTATLPEDRYEALAAEVSGLSVEAANRRAQEVARRLAGHRPAPQVAAAPEPTMLTPREREVLAVLASGLTNREIAEHLGMSTKTVMHHSVAIYRKLGVRGRAGATAWAYQHRDPAP